MQTILPWDISAAVITTGRKVALMLNDERLLIS